MPVDEGSGRRGPSYSPSRSPAAAGARLYGALSQRQQRSSPAASRKPPEPLRRAVADCLSAPAPLHGSPSALSSEAARTLRDYIANPTTTDIAYNVLIEHALAERDRSPAVVPRCVALLKLYLLRYTPTVQTLRQIDLFCINSIAECEPITNQRVSLWSKSLSRQSGPSAIGSNAFSSSISASNFASVSLVKSLNYVHSLVVRHIPKLSFQPLALSGASNAEIQSLPTLSSLLSKSFTSHLSPEVKSRDSPERKEISGASTSNMSSLEKVDEEDGNKYVFSDLLLGRWSKERDQSPSFMRQSGGAARPRDVHIRSFLEVGAAALLVGDMEAKVKEHPWNYIRTRSLPDIDQLLQPSSATTATNFASSQSHLKAIAASKRMKQDPHQVWTNVPVSTFHPRAHHLFQYRYYSEQQPLRLNPAEICEVIAEVCSDLPTTNANLLNAPSRLTNHRAQPSIDVAVSVLIKLVIDMYVMDSSIAAPLARSMLEDMLSSPKVASRIRVFDLILNLAIHAHLLEPMFPEDPHMIEEDEVSQELNPNNEEQPATLGKIDRDSKIEKRMSSAIDDFESWLLAILYEILCLLVQMEEREEIVWASALSCLFYFACAKGKILRDRLEGLDIRVIKTLLEISRENSWAEIVNCKLICMLTNMFYQASYGPTEALSNPPFLVEQVDLLGGIEFICLEYSRANSREDRHNLFLVLFDYVLHQINEACIVSGASAYVYDEIQPVASLLALADAPEAFYISVKHGVEGIGEILRSSISAALSRSPNYEHLNLLLEKITRKLDSTISTFTRLDGEFSFMFQATKSYKFFSNIEDGLGEAVLKARLSWATLHSLLHSERSAYRHNGYIWLVELLLLEIRGDGNQSTWLKIKNLQQHIGVAGGQNLTCSSVPLPICIMCGLLKSKHNFIRWGFLFVLEKLLMRCKLLLDECEPQNVGHEDVVNHDQTENRLHKANAVIDIMSCALSLMINETDHINILKMCEILFSQLCLRLPYANGMPLGDLKSLGHLFGRANESFKIDLEAHVLQGSLSKKIACRDDLPEGINTGAGTQHTNLSCETASMAALLLRGHAIVPMQLVAHVPTSLFYWPLIQLAGAATDDIALGVAVGSKGRGNLPGATSDIRAAILLLLIGKCTADPKAFQELEGEEFFRELLDDTDSRVAYYSSAFLLKRMMTEEPEKYQRMLQSLIFKAQQSNNEKLLENPYLQMCGILQLSNDLGTQ